MRNIRLNKQEISQGCCNGRTPDGRKNKEKSRPIIFLTVLLAGFSAMAQENNNRPDSIIISRISGIKLPSPASGLYVEGNHCYVADGDSGLQIVEIADIKNPKLAGSLTNVGTAVDVLLNNQTAYIASIDSGLQIVDISDSNALVKLSGLMMDYQPVDLEISGDFLYLVDEMSLSIINVEDVSAPFISGKYEPLYYSMSVALKDDYAYSLHCHYSQEYCELVVIDISNPARPLEVSHYDSLDFWDQLIMNENYLYVAGYNDGLRIFDISTASAPYLISHWSTLGSPADYCLSDGKAFLIESNMDNNVNVDGLEIVDCDDPKAPRSVCRYRMGIRSGAIFVQQDLIFIGTDSLFILKYQ